MQLDLIINLIINSSYLQQQLLSFSPSFFIPNILGASLFAFTIDFPEGILELAYSLALKK